MRDNADTVSLAREKEAGKGNRMLGRIRGRAIIHRSALPLACASVSAAAQTYSLVDLGTLGGTTSYGQGINASGQVTGYAYLGGNAVYHAYLYSNGGMTDLGTLGGANSIGYGINASGQVTGQAALAGTPTSSQVSHAFLGNAASLADLGSFGGSSASSSGNAINDSGQVTGDSYWPSGNPETAFLYSNGTMTALLPLDGFNSVGQGINASSQVTGFKFFASGANHAALSTGVTFIDLGTLGGTNSQGISINASAQITGLADIANDAAYHAFLYNGSGMIDLGTLGGQYSKGNGINVSGQIVGNADVAGGLGCAFLYANGVMTDLNALVDASDPLKATVTLTSGSGINDNG